MEEDFLPFRDDILFELSWPGPQEGGSQEAPNYESQVGGEEGIKGPDRVGQVLGDGGVAIGAVGKVKSSILLPEEEYDGVQFVDVRTGNGKERYRCVLPEILSPEDSGVSVCVCRRVRVRVRVRM